MEWIDTRKKNHQFVKFIVNNHKKELEWAVKTASLKVNNTVDSWQQRTIYKRFTNIFLGDLAKNIFKTFLITENVNLKEKLIEYDEIRTDNFKNKDEFDLRIYKNDKYCNFEVKSSGEKYSNNYNDLLKRNIIVNYGNIHQHLECAIIQIIFVPNNLSFFKNENYFDENLDTFIKAYLQDFTNANILAYIVGYANKEMQEKALNERFEVENVKAKSKPREYGRLSIENSLPIRDFLDRIQKVFS
ncbi:hypothetical protein JJD26997_0952 [Campylobacter jejuni subsp. doylei 269.97]|uniref:Uncharacterized protein n=2 Tax=Campylobacter jejuni subsp. doylei TaxID=32021 RepID=A0A448J722_CAMJU|nr:hypothetical protein JJD26997_0952 [Campylobacter jejuni subsp. doylei 269.97]AVL47315.1 hypothetical protein CEP74_05800 [Campylobacter jejuni subsp. doylei]EAJ7530433.1 hypothetical protein [Campylobacter jejuni]VEG60476.1 Uncharacterised protein [Campylobacter jejuni subsp. doylei]